MSVRRQMQYKSIDQKILSKMSFREMFFRWNEKGIYYICIISY